MVRLPEMVRIMKVGDDLAQKFVKCFSQSDCDELKDKGLKFLFKENGIYWLMFNDSINFSNSQVKFEITDVVNL